MTDRDQGAEAEPSPGPEEQSGEVQEFLREFAEYAEPTDAADANDFLDVGLPSATGMARSAAVAAQAVAAPPRSPAKPQFSQKVEKPEATPEPVLGAFVSERQLEALMGGNVVGASLPDDRFSELFPQEEAPQTIALGVDLQSVSQGTEGNVPEASAARDVSRSRVDRGVAEAAGVSRAEGGGPSPLQDDSDVLPTQVVDVGGWVPSTEEGETTAADAESSADELLRDADQGAVESPQMPQLIQAEVDALVGDGPGQPATTAEVASGEDEAESIPAFEFEPADETDAAELTEAELMAALASEPVVADARGSVLLEQAELDALEPQRVQLEQELQEEPVEVASAQQRAGVAEEEEEASEPVPVIRATGGRALLGLPVFAWALIGLAPLILIVSMLGYAVIGRGSAPGPAQAEPTHAAESQVEISPEPSVEAKPVEEHPTEDAEAAGKGESPAQTPEPRATAAVPETPAPEATPEPTAKPDLRLPQFIFADPDGDGMSPSTGLAKQNLVPQADIVSLQVETTSSDGRPGTGGELTDDGFAGPSAGLEVTVTLRGSLGELGKASYRLELFGRFKSAVSDTLAPDGAQDLAPGSQITFRLANAGGGWVADQVVWNKELNAPVRIGKFTNFAVAQNRVRLTIPSPLLSQVMPEGLDKDDFQFFVRVAYFAEGTEVMDEIGRQELVARDPTLLTLSDLLSSGKPTRTPEELAGLDAVQLKLIKHTEQRTLALLSVADTGYLVAQPISR